MVQGNGVTVVAQPEKKPDPIDVHVGRRLRLRRDLLKISQEHLANSVGVTFQQIQKYEQGKNRVSASRLYDIAKVLEVEISYFFDGLEADTLSQRTSPIAQALQGAAEPLPKPLDDDPLSRTESLELLRAYWKISNPEARSRLLELAKSMSSMN